MVRFNKVRNLNFGFGFGVNVQGVHLSLEPIDLGRVDGLLDHAKHQLDSFLGLL